MRPFSVLRSAPARPRTNGRPRGGAYATAILALASLAALASPVTPAAAQVTYRRLDFGFPSGVSGPYVVNLVDGSTFGTSLPGVFPACPGAGCDWDFGVRFGDLPSWRLILPGTQGVTSPVGPAERGVVGTGPSGAVQALALGTIVGESSTFNTNASGANADPLEGLGDQFVGLRFRNEVGGTVHYAWARLRLTAPGRGGTVIDYAFEATPGRAIAVGAGLDVSVVPEPAAVALVAAGLALVGGVTRCRARRVGA